MTPTPTPKLLDFGGSGRTSGGRARRRSNTPIRVPTARCLRPGSRTRSRRMWTQFGQIDIDTLAVPTIAPCSVTGNTAANLPATTACIGSTAFFNALKSSYPELIGTARINQPWGHVQIGAMVRTDQLNDGQFLDQSYVGYGGTISGDVHPFSGTPGALGKDDLGFGLGVATEPGGQFANGAGVVTNFGRTLNVPGFGLVNPLTSAQWNTAGSPTRRAYDRVVRVAVADSGERLDLVPALVDRKTCGRRSR